MNSNLYVGKGVCRPGVTGGGGTGGGFSGYKTAGGLIDRIALTTVIGTDTFDTGTICVFYEG
jgi:hypothetical protein